MDFFLLIRNTPLSRFLSLLEVLETLRQKLTEKSKTLSLFTAVTSYTEYEITVTIF